MGKTETTTAGSDCKHSAPRDKTEKGNWQRGLWDTSRAHPDTKTRGHEQKIGAGRNRIQHADQVRNGQIDKTGVDTHETNRLGTQHNRWQLEAETLTWEKTPGAAQIEEAQATLARRPSKQQQQQQITQHYSVRLDARPKSNRYQTQNRSDPRVNIKEKMRGIN
jgi:hypothetical protein